jgi:hypothetical protein
MRLWHALFLLAVVACLGCGAKQAAYHSQAPEEENYPPEEGETLQPADGSVRFKAGRQPAQDRQNGIAGGGAAFQKEAKDLDEPRQLRKIVRTAEVEVIVQDFDKAEQELKRLLQEQKDGYVAQSAITGSVGAPRSGYWRVRLPLSQLDAFLDAVAALGVPRKKSLDAKDVTEEYYDLEARLKNKKTEEERLLKHLDKSTGKLEDILAVERELTRVRGEIEQMEGRRRLLANLTTLTTVTITIREVKNYVPPRETTFAANVSGTFSESVDLLVGFGKSLTLLVVALVPWLPVLVMVGVPAWWFVRRIARGAATQSPSAP